MFSRETFDLDDIAQALADQTDYEHHWLIDPRTGELVFWTSDTGIDGQNPVDLDELDLILIEPLPPSVWWQDMEDFALGVSDPKASARLLDALQGRGAFRRFKHELYEWQSELIEDWHAFRDSRARQRAREWLEDNGLIERESRASDPSPDT